MPFSGVAWAVIGGDGIGRSAREETGTDDQRQHDDQRADEHRGGGAERRADPLDQLPARVERAAARRREDGDEHGETEGGAELMGRVHEARRGTRVLRCDTGDAGRGERSEEAALPDADEDHRQHEPVHAGARGRGEAEPGHADHRADEADEEDAAVADATGQPRHGHRHREVGKGRGEEGDAVLERGVAGDALEVLAEEEPEADHRGEDEDACRVGAAPLPVGEEAEREDRLHGATLPEDEGGEQEDAGGERRQRDRVGPAGGAGALDAVDERAHAQGRAHGPGDVELSRPPLRLGEMARSRHHQDDPDRQVEEEADAPAEQLGEHAADDEPEARGDAGDGAVGGDGAGALAALGEARREQGEGRGGEERGAGALDGAAAEEHGGGLGEADGERAEGEDREPGDEHAPAAEDVADPGAEEEESAEGEGVGALHPGETGGRHVEAIPDRRQRGDDDRDVEDDHQVAGQDDREDGRAAKGHAGASSP